MLNQQVTLCQRPQGAVSEDCFSLVEAELPAVEPNDVLVRNIYLSCDPYMRLRMAGEVGYADCFPLQQVVEARVVGQVLQSRHPSYAEGDYVWGFLGWERYSHVPGGVGLHKIDPQLGPVSYAISLLGMPGLTAYVGINDVAQARAGDTVFVSAAAGAVGQVAGQLAKLQGCRVVGAAGAAHKVEYLQRELGFDAAFNYKEGDLSQALQQTCPDGIDVYFDNVGGQTLDTTLLHLNNAARVAVCGMISHYQSEAAELHNLQAILHRRVRLEGFVIYDHVHKLVAYQQRMSRWLQAGQVRYREDIVQGLENAPQAFIGMLAGDNLGKRLVQVSELSLGEVSDI